MRNVPGLEAVHNDYKDEVAFYYVYKALAHPEKDGFVQPLTLEERLAHIAAAKKRLGTEVPWLADSMGNDLKHAFGDRNNSEFIISPDGEIAVARAWSDPAALRGDLERLVGKSETTTRPHTGRGAAPERSGIARGVVPRLPRPGGATALVTKPVFEEGGHPFYVKLRAEAGRGALQPGGKGQLYLGFHVDPIHTVHWNNLAEPLRWKIEAPEGVEVADPEGVAPEVAHEADVDPREFLVELSLEGEVPAEPLVLTVDYFACDDEEKWCRAVRQRYEITLAPDRDAGRVQAGGGRRRGGGPPGGRPGGRGRPDPAQILARFDADGDGKVSADEARGILADRFGQIDRDGDGHVTKAELEARFAGP